MANMSYIRFENTFNDLVDCYENIESAVSDREKECRYLLINLCKKIVDEYGEDNSI